MTITKIDNKTLREEYLVTRDFHKEALNNEKKQLQAQIDEINLKLALFN